MSTTQIKLNAQITLVTMLKASYFSELIAFIFIYRHLIVIVLFLSCFVAIVLSCFDSFSVRFFQGVITFLVTHCVL